MSIGENRPTTERAVRHHRLAVAGGLSLLAVAGVGALVLFTHDENPTPDVAGIAPVVVAPSSTGVDDAEATAEIDLVPDAAPASLAASPSPSTTAVGRTPPVRPATEAPEKVRGEIESARAKAAREGHPLQRPFTAPSSAVVKNADSLIEETRDLPDGGTMRIISARYNLSHQREMLLAADEGKSAGSARCTQNFRFAQGAKPSVRPNMLLCWRITEDRSVVVLSVSRSADPAQTQNLNALDTTWDRLG